MCRKNCCTRKIRHRTIMFRHLECFSRHIDSHTRLCLLPAPSKVAPPISLKSLIASVTWRVARVLNSRATLFPNRALFYSVQLCWQNAERWLMQLYCATLLHTRATKLREKIADVSVLHAPLKVPQSFDRVRQTENTGTVTVSEASSV